MTGTASQTPILAIENLQIDVATRRGTANIVDRISIALAPGEALGVVGESGCGKSITMLGLLGLLPHGVTVGGGRALWKGKDLLAMPESQLRKLRGSEIGFIFQDPMTSFNPVMTIGDQLIEPLIYHRQLGHKAAMEQAGNLLELVGIPGGRSRLRDYPHQLSGGMRQRVMIAMGLACNPELLIADEPTTALDVTIQAQIVELVKDLRTRLAMSIIWITHDLALVSGLVDRIVVLYGGQVVEEALVDDLYDRPLHPYTQALLDALPGMTGPTEHRLTTIGGKPPEPGRRPAGCAFAPRCPRAVERCRLDIPPLAALPDGHRFACWVAMAEQGIVQ